jgi:hypothetical protein
MLTRRLLTFTARSPLSLEKDGDGRDLVLVSKPGPDSISRSEGQRYWVDAWRPSFVDARIPRKEIELRGER